MDETVFTNIFNEQYNISKLKYYISNINFVALYTNKSKNVYLIDASKNDSISITAPKSKIIGIQFQIGIDSLLNCSGAQTGVLDPLNELFWTWNSGYINFKLEGTSTSSTADKQRIEQHIGGYKAPYKTMRKLYLEIPTNYFVKNKTLIIQMDLDKYWKATNEIHIAEKPVIASVGQMASDAADNFLKMFLIKKYD